MRFISVWILIGSVLFGQSQPKSSFRVSSLYIESRDDSTHAKVLTISGDLICELVPDRFYVMLNIENQGSELDIAVKRYQTVLQEVAKVAKKHRMLMEAGLENFQRTISADFEFSMDEKDKYIIGNKVKLEANQTDQYESIIKDIIEIRGISLQRVDFYSTLTDSLRNSSRFRILKKLEHEAKISAAEMGCDFVDLVRYSITPIEVMAESSYPYTNIGLPSETLVFTNYNPKISRRTMEVVFSGSASFLLKQPNK